MIDVKRLKTFPYELKFSNIATKEMLAKPELIEYVMERSCAWLISKNGVPLFIGGVLKLSLVGGPTRLWFVGVDGFECYAVSIVKYLRRALKHMVRFLGELSVVIDEDCLRSKNFAHAFGFRSTSHIFHEQNKSFRYCVLR